MRDQAVIVEDGEVVWPPVGGACETYLRVSGVDVLDQTSEWQRMRRRVLLAIVQHGAVTYAQLCSAFREDEQRFIKPALGWHYHHDRIETDGTTFVAVEDGCRLTNAN